MILKNCENTMVMGLQIASNSHQTIVGVWWLFKARLKQQLEGIGPSK